MVNLPPGFADAFRGSSAGRRFLLNFFVGYDRGDFTLTGSLCDFLQAWFDQLASEFVPLDVKDVSLALARLDGLASKRFSGYACSQDVYRSRADLEELSRVIDVDILALDPTYSLLDPAVIDGVKASSGTDDKFSDDLNHFIEELSGDASALRDGGMLRSRLPFSWAAPAQELTRRVPMQGASALADKFRDLLATPHYPRQHYLHRLEYPPKSGEKVGLHRPTSFEAGSQPYFRARTDGLDLCGRTVNLEHFGQGLPADEGVPEVLVPAIPVSPEMTWHALGPICEAPIDPDEPAHEITLHPDVVAAVGEAIKLLESA